jgi:hypothetical protein
VNIFCSVFGVYGGIMNPNYLSGEELLYELRLRGIIGEGDVQSFRKLFRSVVARDLPQELGGLKES